MLFLIGSQPELQLDSIKARELMSEETERTKELVEAAYGLAQRSRTLRAQVNELNQKAARIRRAGKKVRDELNRNGRNHKS